jgi:hypothetical protein
VFSVVEAFLLAQFEGKAQMQSTALLCINICGNYIVVICAVVLRGEMTTGKTAEASALQGDGTSCCYQYDICLWMKNKRYIDTREILWPVENR